MNFTIDATTFTLADTNFQEAVVLTNTWNIDPHNLSIRNKATFQAPVNQTMDSATRRINHYPLDSAIDFAMSYPLDSIYPADSVFHRLNNWDQLDR